MVEMAVLGISLQKDGNIPVLLLHPHGTQKILSLRIGPMEAFAISMALHLDSGVNIQTGREKTLENLEVESFAEATMHLLARDFALHMLRALDGHLLAVELTGFKEGAFLAEAVLSQAGRLVRVPCRPSDGVALALRCDATVRATESVVVYAEEIDFVMAQLPEYVRTLAAAKLVSLSCPGEPPVFSHIPPILGEALAAKFKDWESGQWRALIGIARKMLEEEQEKASRTTEFLLSAKSPQQMNLDVADQRTTEQDDGIPSKQQGQTVTIIPVRQDKNSPSIKIQPIHITLTPPKRNQGRGALNELEHSARAITRKDLVRLGLTISETEAFQAASAEERWATLLHLLAPETKVPM